MITDGKFFITGSHSTAFFQMTEQPLDRVAFFVRLLVEMSGSSLLVRFVGNDRCHATLPKSVPVALRRTSLVTGDLFRTFTSPTCRSSNRNLVDCRKDKRIVARLTASYQTRQRQQIIFARHHDLRRPSAFRLADSVVGGLGVSLFFFKAPAADLWALTIVPSTENRDQSILPSALNRINNFSRIKSQVPSNCHKRYRAYIEPHLPYFFGKSRQGAPVLRLHKMPLMIRRRSCIFRPRPMFNGGRQGSKTSHCLSDNSWRSIGSSFLKMDAKVSFVPNPM